MAKKAPKGKEVKRVVPFKLTEGEKTKKAEAAAKLNEQLEAAVERKKVAMADHNAKIKSFQERITKFLKEINEGVERREAAVTEVKNFEDNKVEFWLEGKVVDSREMTPDDRQEELKIAEKPKKDKWQKMAPKRIFPVSSQEAREREEIAEVHKLETSRGTKKSSVDGPTP